MICQHVFIPVWRIEMHIAICCTSFFRNPSIIERTYLSFTRNISGDAVNPVMSQNNTWTNAEMLTLHAYIPKEKR